MDAFKEVLVASLLLVVGLAAYGYEQKEKREEGWTLRTGMVVYPDRAGEHEARTAPIAKSTCDGMCQYFGMSQAPRPHLAARSCNCQAPTGQSLVLPTTGAMQNFCSSDKAGCDALNAVVTQTYGIAPQSIVQLTPMRVARPPPEPLHTFKGNTVYRTS